MGFQLALPPPAWKVLEEDFGVQAKIPKWGDICCTNGEMVGDNKIFFLILNIFKHSGDIVGYVYIYIYIYL